MGPYIGPDVNRWRSRTHRDQPRNHLEKILKATGVAHTLIRTTRPPQISVESLGHHTQKGDMKQKTREQQRIKRLEQELITRKVEKATAPPVSRHAEKIASLIGTQPRPMPEEGEREEPVPINREYMDDLIMQREEESGAKIFISIPSTKILREQRTDHKQQQEESDKEWAEIRSTLIHNTVKARPKGTWRTYEDKQEAFKVLISHYCHN